MLLAALLLIQWVTLTIGATAPPFPHKEIHLQIPTESHFTTEHSRISPLIFRDSRNLALKHRVKTPFIPKEINGTPLSVNPSPEDISVKPRYGRDVMNLSAPSHLSLSTKHIPTTENIKSRSLDNTRSVAKMTYPLNPKDIQEGKGEENDTFLNESSAHYNTEHLRESANSFSNDTVSNLYIPNHKSSSDYDKNKNEKYDVFEGDLDRHLADPYPSERTSANRNFNKTKIPQEGKRITYTDFLSSTFLPFKSKNQSRNTKSSETEKIFNIDSNEYSESEVTQKSNYNNNLNIGNNYSSNILTTISSIKLTRRPKLKSRNNRKNKDTFKFSASETDKSFNTSSRIPMLQDGTYQTVTSLPALFSENNSWFRSEVLKKHFEDNSNHKSDTFNKNSTLSFLFSSPLTTPDSHMNDPPFRGPNIPPEIDHFYKEEEKTKMDYYKPKIVETPAFLISYFGEDWKPFTQIKVLAWDCHFYVIGSLFALIAVYTFISLLRIHTFVTLLKTGYYVIINSIILLLCLLRTVYLLYDPYNLSRKYPDLIASILLKITLPFLTSGFLMLQLSFLNSTNTQLLSSKLQRPCVLAITIISAFVLYFIMEVVVYVFQAPIMVLLTGYLLLIAWAMLSSISYFCIYRKLHHRALRKQGEMIRLTFTKMHIDGAQLPKRLPKPTLGLSVKLVLFSAILQIILCILTVTAILQVLFPQYVQRDPWIWWGYQLTCRILELLIAATMSFIATQPLKHYEMEENRFCSILMWFPCSSFADCCKKQEIIDFEVHSDNYANPQGLRNSGLNITANARRLQTNSLPTFRTPLTEVDKSLPMRTLPCSGRHNNHASAISLLSYYRSKRTLSVSTNEGLEDLERTLCNQTTSSSDGRNNTLRPASMLYKDNGFIRFRRENDPEQPMELSDEDDRIEEDPDTSLEDAESTKANVGSSFQSLLDGDIVQNTLSPFFQIGYKRRFRKMSRVSIETTDYSADVSSDQLSNVVNLRNGLSSSALDFNTRKYGSTCSSESAANSFDVTFFLNSNSSPEMQTSPTSTTPASLNVCSAYRSETEDDKTSSVEGHEVMLRSVSPIVKRASSGRLSLNLNLQAAGDVNHSNGHVNVACGTEDITPDSAVYLDLQLSRNNTISPKSSTKLFPSKMDSPTKCPLTVSLTKSTDDIGPISPVDTSVHDSPTVSPTTQSLGELRTSNSYVVIPRFKKNSKGLLYKLRGSTFSLNAAIYGYEPLEQVEHSKGSRNKLERSSSDRQPLSEAQLDVLPQMTPLGELRNRSTGTGSGFLGDSGLLGDCGVTLVDVASQTEDTEFNECDHKTCTMLTKNSPNSNSQSLFHAQLINIEK